MNNNLREREELDGLGYPEKSHSYTNLFRIERRRQSVLPKAFTMPKDGLPNSAKERRSLQALKQDDNSISTSWCLSCERAVRIEVIAIAQTRVQWTKFNSPEPAQWRALPEGPWR